jgi:lipoate-protein ligase A
MRKTNLKKSIVAASVAAGIAGGLVAGLALGVPGFAGAQANNSPLNVQGSSAVLAKSAVVTLSDTIQVPSVGASSTGAKEKGAKLEAVAKVLGVTAEELKTELATKSLADIAEAKGVDITKVTDALVAEFKVHLDEEVASGEHTQAEADAKLAEFKTRVTDMVNNVRPAGGPEGRGHGGPGMGHGMGHGPKLETVAKVLGVTAEELKAELATKSLADIAKAKGVDITKVTDALVAELKAHLDEDVASGKHTQAEADAKLAKFTTRVTEMVNTVRPAGGPEGRGQEGRGPRGHGGPGMGRGMGHGPDADGDAMAGAPAMQGSVTVTPSNNA